MSDEFRAGFVSFVGRPNVGKSTLTNALVGEKIAITSPKPQTTRRAIRGVAHREHGQLIIVDTPGIHRPRTLLGERLNALVEATLGDERAEGRDRFTSLSEGYAIQRPVAIDLGTQAISAEQQVGGEPKQAVTPARTAALYRFE